MQGVSNRGRGGKPRSHRYSNQTQANNNNVPQKPQGNEFIASQQSQDGSASTQMSQGPLTQGMSMSMSQPFGMSQPGLSQVEFSQVAKLI